MGRSAAACRPTVRACGLDVLLAHDAPMLPPGMRPLADPILRADCYASNAGRSASSTGTVNGRRADALTSPTSTSMSGVLDLDCWEASSQIRW